ncbi:MAG TPA: glutamyl-tRNA reductase [Mycobacteriales bacterium]|nr:glutamyl-tRNA reductase [Mycobacteriales bacterium]
MSVLVVGLSHRSAPVALLERAALAADDVPKVLVELLRAPGVDEALVASTCNRVEVYAEVEKFHGGVQAISDLLAQVSGIPLDELTDHLYVHYEDRAVQHLFTVACGLDSMVVGEAQILGQLRSAYAVARKEGALGRTLTPLVQRALRVGKRAHSETGIDKAGQSLVSVGLDLGAQALGGLVGRSALIVGAGSMAALAGATLRRADAGAITVANRTPAHAARLADSLGGRGAGLAGLTDAIADVDLLVCCTGATGAVVSVDAVETAMSRRPDRPLFVLDLALPRDVDAAVRQVPGITLVDLEALRAVLEGEQVARDVEAVRRIVTDDVADYLSQQRSARVAPTVVALRSKAQDVMDAELLRLAGRLPDVDERTRREIGDTVRRVVDKLLHAPTVRVKELAGAPGGDSYAEALRELFDLDPAAPVAVTRADVAVDEDGAP